MIELDQMSEDEMKEFSDGELIAMLSRQGLAIGMINPPLAYRLNKIAEKLFGLDLTDDPPPIQHD